jgi:hypothetical protein
MQLLRAAELEKTWPKESTQNVDAGKNKQFYPKDYNYRLLGE